MKTLIFSLAVIALFTFVSFTGSTSTKSINPSFDLPNGWFIAGNNPNSYKMGIDKTMGKDGKNAATIKSAKKKIKGFGTLMQMCKADKYKGKKVKMSGSMKSENVKDWAGFWLRVDGASGECLAFDNMQDRSVKKTTDWTNYEITLNVSEGASNLAYGALLSGTGQIWFDNITFEIVGNAEKTTDTKDNSKTGMLEEPMNLDFEK